MAISGDAILAGRYVFERSPQGWTRTATLVPSDGVTVGRGDISGNIAVFAGGYTFTKMRGYWSESARLVAPGSTHLTTVAIDGDTIAAGDPYSNGGLGAAYAFSLTDAGWVYDGELEKVNSGSTFGDDGAVDRGLIAVGRRCSFGSVSLFAKGRDGWERQRSIYDHYAHVGDDFGASVAMSNGTIAVGAPLAWGVVYGE